MELELNRTHFTGYETVLDTTLFQEETLETIVPDASPDILRLVDTRGTVLLKSRTTADGRVVLAGTARMSILYFPEGGAGICRLEIGIPFSIAVEEKKIRAGCLVVAVPRISAADTRALNPRKIITRAEIAVSLRVFASDDFVFCTGVRAADGTVEQLIESHRPVCISAVQEKQVSFEDNLNIPAGRPAAEELLHSRVELSCNEARVIGNKLIFKGEAAVQLLYRSDGMGLNAADFTLPFSQIAEVAGVGEEGNCSVEMCLTGAEFVLNDDGRTVSASLSMLAQAVVWENRTVELLTDAYSTCCAVRAERIPYDYRVCQAAGTERQTVREVIESGLSLRSVLDTYCAVGRVTQNREGDQVRVTVQAEITAICLTEDEELCAIARRLEVGCMVAVPEECSCLVSCRCGDLVAAPSMDGVEVRFSLEIPYLSLRESHAMTVRDISVESAVEREQQRPSIVLRRLDEGERLWDVAKRYGTTREDIIRANALENEQPCGGTLLLIPRKR